jgi:hypothetical protein
VLFQYGKFHEYFFISNLKSEKIMAVYKIENYVLRYDMDSNKPWVIFHYKEGTSWRNKNWFPPAENVVYLADMLRNEKPLYYVESSSGKKWITSGSEEIGEEET